ncbi:hypothetical protein PS659_05972 [Pseudomonas fluorescens]|uniref:Uncharacterized protein n=1 Tax=Pseudomonas fluorescens TaxID=294 RepID=A0A5E6Y4C6_PSEFL|nr:hypothetical protein PS659_05972 [Pseudomonas fluorescens]
MVKLTTLTGPSTLLVPVRTLPLKAVSSRVEGVSLASVKLSLTGVTLMFSELLEPVLVVYVTCGTLPFQSAAGLKV